MARNWAAIQTRLTITLLALGVVLASVAVLQIMLSLLGRFSGTIFMFVVGAIVAYLLIPLVNGAQKIVRKRWAAIAVVYLTVFAALVLLGTVLFSPFVSQARSLGANLQKPSPSSLQAVSAVQAASSRLVSGLSFQQGLADSGLTAQQSDIQQIRTEIAALQANVQRLQASTVAQPRPSTPPLRGGIQAPPPQTRVPPSYVAPISDDVNKLVKDYTQATQSAGSLDRAALTRALQDARSVKSAADSMYAAMSSTSLLLLDLQSWLDDHQIKVDIHQSFGQVSKQLSSQTSSLVNNSISMVLAAGTLLVDALLVLIISIYFLSDGPRILRGLSSIGPPAFRRNVPFYLSSLDRTLSGYIRGQVALAAGAGVLGALGAFVLGVPYAVLIGLSTFFLSLVPIIGPIILIVPPALIAVVFTSLPTALILLAYFLVMMQVVTNIIGPRVVGSAVGIHPLEAMAAAFIGYPVAGLLGSFLAVPVVGFLHIAIKHAYRNFVGFAEELEVSPAEMDTAGRTPIASAASAVSQAESTPGAG
ncbi:MAG TPA: AI-2E family transporter [Chloroflexota bacterium]